MEIERNVAYSRQSRRVYAIGEEYIRDYGRKSPGIKNYYDIIIGECKK